MEKPAARTERLILTGRLVLAVTAFAALLVDPPHPGPTAIFSYLALGGYLTYSSTLLALAQRAPKSVFYPGLTYAVDVACLLGVLLFAETSGTPFFLFYLFVVFVTSVRWGLRGGLVAAGALAGFFLLFGFSVLPALGVNRRAFYADWRSAQFLVAALCLLGIGFLVSRLGQREHLDLSRLQILTGLAACARVEQGFRESLRQLVAETQRVFRASRAFIVFEDIEAGRLLVWKSMLSTGEELVLEERRLEERALLFQEEGEPCFRWHASPNNQMGHWEGRRGLSDDPLAQPPRLVGSFAGLYQATTILSAPFQFHGKPVGRVILLDKQDGPFSEDDLDLLQLLVQQLAPVLENVLTLRQLRWHAIQRERDRIARDLHDGVVQTLASIEMQLDVLRRLAGLDPARMVPEIEQLQRIVKTESGELREFVTDLKPLQIESADLVEMIELLVARFREETGLAVDLRVDRVSIDLPEASCREVFQIVREALNNIKKHAQATHVVIKMKQDERYLHMVFDDNGKGFSFAGTYTTEALEALRLGPISIKERAQALQGRLTIESNPGHGARLHVDIPI